MKGRGQRYIRLTRAPLSPETTQGANHCWEETLWSRAVYKLCRGLPSGVTALELPVFLQTAAMKSLVHLDRFGKNHSALGEVMQQVSDFGVTARKSLPIQCHEDFSVRVLQFQVLDLF